MKDRGERTHVRRKSEGKNYPICKRYLGKSEVCNTPIRPNLFINPIGIIDTHKGIDNWPLELRFICEVCYKEESDDSRDIHCEKQEVSISW
jgi:hypothetical protein